MKSSTRRILAAALFALSASVCAAAPDAAPANLLQNPGFENRLDGWRVPRDPHMGEVSVSTDAHSGQACLCIRKTVASQGDEYTGVLVAQTVQVEPNTFYVVRGFARYDLPESAPAHAVRLFIEEPDRRDSAFAQHIGRWGKWKGFKAIYHTGPNTHQLRVAVGLTYAAGTAWFDDLSMAPVSPTALDADISQLKPLLLRTAIVEAGAPQAIIVVANRAEQQALAQDVVAQVFAATGTRLPIKLDTEIAESELKTTNVITLGNLTTNRLVERLYCRWYVRTDAWYPGRGGYEVRTVHDPWGSGKNIILLGASDDAGLRAAVAEFLQLIRPGRDLLLDRLLTIKLSPDLAREEFTRRFSDRALQDYRKRIKRLTMRSLISRAGEYAFNYYASGNEQWVALFKECLLEHKSRGELGYDTHMELWYALIGFDLVEESPSLTDADRGELTKYLLYLCRSEEGANKSWFLRDIPHDAIRHNHVMLAGLDAFFGGEYFQKYYHLEEATEWLENAAQCFEGQQLHSKTQCDANAYECFAVSVAMVYALAKPDRRFFDSGAARKATERLIRCLDNMLYEAAYGDSWDPFGFPHPMLQMANWYCRDPRYAYLLQQRAARDRQSPWSKNPIFGTGAPAAKPTDLDGVQAIACDPAFYAYWTKGKKTCLPLEKTFDKIAFRERFDPAAQYLLLDGLNIGSHGHTDANTIIEFSDRERMFLVDMSYTDGVELCDHNGVTVVCNGLSTEPAAGAEIEAAADFPATGFSRSTLHEHSGTDWSRNILWRKGRYFLVLDQLTARQPGDFSLQCLWRVLGKPSLMQNTFTADQAAVRFVLRNAGGVEQEFRDAGPGFNHYWNRYPHCEPRVTVLRQKAQAVLSPAESYIFCNLFYAAGTGAADAEYRLRRVGPARVVIDGKEPALAGLAVSGFQADALRVCAALYHLRPDGISLVDARSLDVGVPLLRASRPITVECDLASGEMLLTAAEDTEVSFAGVDSGLKVDGVRTPAKSSADGLLSLRVTAGKHTITGFTLSKEWRHTYRQRVQTMVASLPSAATQPAAARPEKLQATPMSLRWKFDTQGSVQRIVCANADKDGKAEIIVGTADNKIHLLDAAGRLRWQYTTTGAVNALATCDLGGDDHAAVVAGGDDAQVYAIDANGRLKWKFACPPMDASVPYTHYGSKGAVRSLWAGALQKGQTPLVFVGPENGYLWCLNAKGELLWKYRTMEVPTFLAAVDLKGDGNQQMISGSSLSSWSALTLLSAKGDGRALNSLDGWGSHVTALAVGGANGKAQVVAGTSKNNLCLLDAQGKLQWKILLGDAPTQLVFADLDGQQAVIVGSPSSFVYAVRLDGKMLWRTNVGEEVAALATAPSASRKAVLAAGTRSGRIVRLAPDGQILTFYDAGSTSPAQRPPAITQTVLTVDAAGKATGLVFGTSQGQVGFLSLATPQGSH